MSNDCGCGCGTSIAGAARVPVNRPGLPELDYRPGTFATFRRALLHELFRTPELAGLRSRISDDFTISALELWSAVAEVLSFYLERIANDAFLGTAPTRDAVLRLVRLIDYHLSPGVAATTWLAFTLERDAEALIPARSRVQSVPGAGQLPQKYEVLTALQAEGRLNLLRALPAPERLDPTAAAATAASAPDPDAVATLSALAPGDQVVFFAPGAVELLTVAGLTAIDDQLRISWATPLSRRATFAKVSDEAVPGVAAYRLGRTFRLFGHDAPRSVVVAQRRVPTDATTTYLVEASTDFSLHGDGTKVHQLSLDATYLDLEPGSRVLVVASLADGSTKAIPFEVDAITHRPMSRSATVGGNVQVVTQTATVSVVSLIDLTTQTVSNLGSNDVRAVVVHELLGPRLRFWPFAYPTTLTGPTVWVPGRRDGWGSIEVGRTIEKGRYRPGTSLELTDLPPGRALIAGDASGAAYVGSVEAAELVGSQLKFSATSTDFTTLARLGLDPEQAVSLTAVVTGSLSAPPKLEPPRELTVQIGDSPVLTVNVRVNLGPPHVDNIPIGLQTALREAAPDVPAFANAVVTKIQDGYVVIPGVPGQQIRFGPSPADANTVAALRLNPGQTRFLDGVMSGDVTSLIATRVKGSVTVTVGAEVPRAATVDVAVSPAGGLPPLEVLANALAGAFQVRALVDRGGRRLLFLPHPPTREQRSWLRVTLATETPVALDPASAFLLANVAPASHGETVRGEVLGDGDSAASFQRFDLRKKPVTHVPTPTGIESSLQLFVNGALWREVPTLHGTGGTDDVFTTRVADDGTTTLQFGDGTTGARPPTGRNNLEAWYRQGVGLAGRVEERRLTTLLDRPTGVKSVTNPLPGEGGADPEPLNRARRTAPGTVRTFGRAISLRDFEDSTLTAGDVAKARADWVWTGQRRVVHLTVAGQEGAVFGHATLSRLRAMLDTERDVNRPLVMSSYARVAVLISGTIGVHPTHVAATVLDRARAALLDSMTFARRDFAAPVQLSDLYATLQSVEGVRSVDIDSLDLKNPDPDFRLQRGVPAGAAQPVARLLMLPARWSEAGQAVLPAEIAWIEIPEIDVVLRSTGGIVL